MPPYVEAYPNENLTTVMPEQYRYTLPVKAGEQRLLGELSPEQAVVQITGLDSDHPLYPAVLEVFQRHQQG